MRRATGKHAGFRARYGPWALVAGGSEGLGAEFATQIAARGVNLVLLAPHAEPLAALGDALAAAHGVEVRALARDLADPATLPAARRETADVEVGLLVYNAAHAWIGPFLEAPLEEHLAELDVNCRGPLLFAYAFGRDMAARGRGGILLMSSIAGAQGAPGIANYAATKAYATVLAEGLWGELRGRGVDVLACCAGATRTPGYLATRKRRRSGAFPTPEMEPAAVVTEALASLGRRPSLIPGAANRVAALLLQRLLPRRAAVRIMQRSTRGLDADRG